jgi:hypothetical protein
MARNTYKIISEVDLILKNHIARRKVVSNIFIDGAEYSEMYDPHIRAMIYKELLGNGHFPLGSDPSCIEIKSVKPLKK